MAPSAESIFIIGAGRVGTGLALALAGGQVHRLVGLYNRGAEGRERATALSGRRVSGGELASAEGLAAATLILVCVTDDAIGEVAERLAGAELAPDAVVAHTSGCLDATALAAVGDARLGSLHPLCACPDARAAARALRSALYVIEGDPVARQRLARVAEDLGGRTREIDAANKPRYHAAAVMASNLVVALLDHAVGEAAAAGLEPTWANEALVELAIGALQRVGESDAAAALTGPLARGDVETVRRHLGLLAGEAREVYVVLSKRALALALARERGLPEATARELTEALGE